jgi:4'-phosphopantetheinyl transferase
VPRSDSDWVSEHFAAAVRDWSPAAARPAVRLLYAPVASDARASERCLAVLSDAEAQRAERFLVEEGKSLFAQRRAFRRYCGALARGPALPLSQIEFQETEKGRPYLPGAPDLRFSFSSCRLGFLGAWSPTHAIGVDIEARTRPLEAEEMAQRYFAEAEAKAVSDAAAAARQSVFFRLWTLKEAALKSIGEGLPFGLDTFEFELVPTLRMVRAPHGYGRPERFGAHLIETAETCAALVIREGRDTPQGR